MTAYMRFIDEMVEIANRDVKSDLISKNGHPERTNVGGFRLKQDESARKALFLSLSDEQRRLLTEMLHDSRSSAIHGVLAYLEWGIATERLKMSWEGESILNNPCETVLLDYVSREEGYKWPVGE